MPPKIRKRSEKGGLDQPDQVMTTLQSTYGFLDKFKYHIVGGFVGVVVILLGVSWYVGHREDQRKDLAAEFFDAFKYMEAPVGEDVEGTEELPAFATDEAKYAKLTEEMKAFVESHESADIAQTARLVLASAQMETGHYEEAHALLSAFADEQEGSALAPVVYENLGYAAMHLGRKDEAVQHFEKMQEVTASAYVKARALMHLGDLYNPGARAADFEKDAGKAQEYYQKALEALPEETGEGLEAATADPAIALTREELKLRLTLLELG